MNPFEEERSRKINNLSYFFPEAIEIDAAKVFDIGKPQYDSRQVCVDKICSWVRRCGNDSNTTKWSYIAQRPQQGTIWVSSDQTLSVAFE